MTGLKIVQQRRYADQLVGFKFSKVISRKVDHRQEGIGINVVVVTRLLHRLIAKAKVDAETSQHLQQIVIVADQRDHLVISLVHFLILHNYLTPYLLIYLTP